MQDDKFEWDEEKSDSNLRKHKLSFDTASRIFGDPDLLDEIDETMEYGEDRYKVVGMIETRMVAVIYTIRDGRTRLISARKATNSSSWTMQDKKLNPEGSARTDWEAFDAMTDEEVIAAALSDPDNPPMTEEELKRLRPVAKCKRIGWKLGLSRADFASRFRIPLDLVTSWERYQSEPDAVANAYLVVIAADPDAAWRALEAARAPKAAA